MEEKKGRGRPTKYDPEMINEIVPFMSQGYSKEALAGHLSISKETLYQWIKEYPDFSDAIKEGVSKSQMFWEQLGMQGIFTDEKTKFAQGAWVFNMKARFGFTDVQHVETKTEIKLKYNLDDNDE
jgi:transposase-like protein